MKRYTAVVLSVLFLVSAMPAQAADVPKQVYVRLIETGNDLMYHLDLWANDCKNGEFIDERNCMYFMGWIAGSTDMLTLKEAIDLQGNVPYSQIVALIRAKLALIPEHWGVSAVVLVESILHETWPGTDK